MEPFDVFIGHNILPDCITGSKVIMKDMGKINP